MRRLKFPLALRESPLDPETSIAFSNDGETAIEGLSLGSFDRSRTGGGGGVCPLPSMEGEAPIELL
jgi:hypothetical protein